MMKFTYQLVIQLATSVCKLPVLGLVLVVGLMSSVNVKCAVVCVWFMCAAVAVKQSHE